MLTYLIALGLASLIAIACVYGLLFPGRLMQHMTTLWRGKSGMPTTIAIKLLLGLHLIAIAPLSKFPLAIKLIGYLAILAAIAIALAGKERIDRLLISLQHSEDPVIRLWLLAGVLYAGFLIIAVV